jgi:hypothetical protein
MCDQNGHIYTNKGITLMLIPKCACVSESEIVWNSIYWSGLGNGKDDQQRLS